MDSGSAVPIPLRIFERRVVTIVNLFYRREDHATMNSARLPLVGNFLERHCHTTVRVPIQH